MSAGYADAGRPFVAGHSAKGGAVGIYQYGVTDFARIAAGAAVLASGGGGSYADARGVLAELAPVWGGTVRVQDYDGASDCCVLAMMGSPDAAQQLSLASILSSIANTLDACKTVQPGGFRCFIPVEIGPVNSLIPLLAAALLPTGGYWVVDGDGAGRAVPELPQTTFAGAPLLAVSPAVLASDTSQGGAPQSAVLTAPNAAAMETLAGAIVGAFGSISGIALWPSVAPDRHALSGNYIPGTLAQAWALGDLLVRAPRPLTTAAVAQAINAITGRRAAPVVTNFYITDVRQATTSGSLDAGVIRLDNAPRHEQSSETHLLYNLNENLVMYSSQAGAPDVIAPDSICYYSEATGAGFSNALNDLAQYYDFTARRSTGRAVSVIRVEAAPRLVATPGVVASFAALLRNIGYGGAMPYPPAQGRG